MVASYYANAANERGLGIITWTLERAGPGLGGFYFDTTDGIVDLAEGDRFTLLHVLDKEVGILGIFSDWPATTTFYANCLGLKLRGLEEAPEEDPEVMVQANGSDGGSGAAFINSKMVSIALGLCLTMMSMLM